MGHHLCRFLGFFVFLSLSRTRNPSLFSGERGVSYSITSMPNLSRTVYSSSLRTVSFRLSSRALPESFPNSRCSTRTRFGAADDSQGHVRSGSKPEGRMGSRVIQPRGRQGEEQVACFEKKHRRRRHGQSTRIFSGGASNLRQGRARRARGELRLTSACRWRSAESDRSCDVIGWKRRSEQGCAVKVSLVSRACQNINNFILSVYTQRNS